MPVAAGLDIRDGALAMYVAGTSASAVAREFDLATTTVLRWARSAGIPVRAWLAVGRNGESFSAATKAAAVADYAGGLSAVAVARRHATTVTSVRAWCRAAGVPVRGRLVRRDARGEYRRWLGEVDRGLSPFRPRDAT